MSEATDDRVCATCPHWHFDGDVDPDNGECRIRAPRHLNADAYGKSECQHKDCIPGYGLWPQTGRYEWCGEHPERSPFHAWRGDVLQQLDAIRRSVRSLDNGGCL